MNTELDNRTILVKLIERMSDTDTQQMLAYAAGYEAGRISQNSSNLVSNANYQNIQHDYIIAHNVKECS